MAGARPEEGIELGQGLKHKEWLRELGGSIWRKGASWVTSSLSTAPTEGLSQVGTGLLSQATIRKTRGHSLKLCQGIQVGHQEEFLHRKGDKTLEMVESPSLEVFNRSLGMALSALV